MSNVRHHCIRCMRALSRSDYVATMGDSPIRLGPEAVPPFDYWPYFEAIPKSEFDGFDCSGCSVTYVYRNAAANLLHVLVNSTDKNVFMALVLDEVRGKVIGHRLLNLDQEYGLDA